jgi:hypothetical protein
VHDGRRVLFFGLRLSWIYYGMFDMLQRGVGCLIMSRRILDDIHNGAQYGG